MKLFKNIFPIALLLMALQSCVENDPTIEDFPSDRIAFTYEVKGDYQEDFYIGSDIQFSNTSVAKGNAVWNFGDGETSTEAMPTHKYKTAGTYKVSLAVEGEGTNFRNLLISDIFPTVTIDPIKGEGICEVKKVPIHLSVYLPNPENLTKEYEWSFPEGTLNKEGKLINTYDGVDPGLLTFSNVGSQRITLKTKLGGRTLEEGVVNVQVGYSEPAKTIYYAVKNGNLMAYKLASDIPNGIKIAPFDLGVKSGQHPMNILCDDSLIYVLDPGKQFTYVDDFDKNLGDGKISVISKDGSAVETLLSNANGFAFDDPFYGYIDTKNKTLYFSDRNTGISKIGLGERNMEMKRDKYPYFVENNRLLYYNVGYAYGSINTNFTNVDGVWYWGKTFANEGIFRFKNTDIQTTEIKAGEKDKPYPVILPGCFIKSFVIDAERGLVYFIVKSGTTAGFYAAPMTIFTTLVKNTLLEDAVKAKTCKLVKEFSSVEEGTSGEYVDVSQMVLDKTDGSVYFGCRTVDAPGLYKCSVEGKDCMTAKLTLLVPGVEIYGITINNKKSKLF